MTHLHLASKLKNAWSYTSTLHQKLSYLAGKRNPDVDGRIILRWIFRKWEGVVGTGWSGLRVGTGGGHLWVRS
jgi:hypothetical protein